MSNIISGAGTLTLKGRDCTNASILIQSSGAVSTTGNARPAFLVRGCSNTAQANDRVILFNTIVLNRYGCYNASSGTFTAPVSGIYHISYHLFLYHTNGARYITGLQSTFGLINECTIEVPTAGTGQGYSCPGASLNIFVNAGESFSVSTSGGVINTNDLYAYFGAVYLGSSY